MTFSNTIRPGDLVRVSNYYPNNVREFNPQYRWIGIVVSFDGIRTAQVLWMMVPERRLFLMPEAAYEIKHA